MVGEPLLLLISAVHPHPEEQLHHICNIREEEVAATLSMCEDARGRLGLSCGGAVFAFLYS